MFLMKNVFIISKETKNKLKHSLKFNPLHKDMFILNLVLEICIIALGVGLYQNDLLESFLFLTWSTAFMLFAIMLSSSAKDYIEVQ